MRRSSLELAREGRIQNGHGDVVKRLKAPWVICRRHIPTEPSWICLSALRRQQRARTIFGRRGRRSEAFRGLYLGDVMPTGEASALGGRNGTSGMGTVLVWLFRAWAWDCGYQEGE